MQAHSSSCFAGPVSKSREWWSNVNNNFEMPQQTRRPKENDAAPFRAEVVARVRRQIADGTYDTPEKWDRVLDKLAERLFDE